MNCNECKDRVFELIEREASDPEGVREILAACPDCRQLFEEMKAALGSAQQLPLEEPPAAVDAAILRAAAARQRKHRPDAKPWLQAPPWAMAAIALLAIGLGVWAIPKKEAMQRRDEAREALVQAELKPAPAREQSADQDEAAVGGVADETSTVAERESDHAPTHRAKAKRQGANTSVLRSKPASQTVRTEEASGAAADEAGGLATAAKAPAPRALAAEPPVLSEDCRERIARIEERSPNAADEEVAAEQALAIGRCYQEVGNEQEARAWLERAAKDPKTRLRARRALRALSPE